MGFRFKFFLAAGASALAILAATPSHAVTFTSSDTFQVPETGLYEIIVSGAQGGSSGGVAGGLGYTLGGTLVLTKDMSFQVIVGQVGLDGSTFRGAGAGGGRG